MDLKMVNQIEERCRRMSFEEATADGVHLRPMLQAWPSKVIQSRIEFDYLAGLSLVGLTMLQLTRLSALKRRLIATLWSEEDLPEL